MAPLDRIHSTLTGRDLLEHVARTNIRCQDSRVIDFAARALRQRGLTLVLGAGVSISSQIPSWDELVKNAAKRVGIGTGVATLSEALGLLGRTNSVNTRIVEHVLRLRKAYRYHVAAALYESFDRAKRNETLDAVVELALGNGTGHEIRQIITYNFDDLFESRLRKELRRRKIDRRVVSVFSPRSYLARRDPNAFYVYHPHGFLPRKSKGGQGKYIECPIVFSELDYHRHFFEYTYWANLVQIEAFSRTTCMFVGLSISDGNMRRLLDYVRFGHEQPVQHVVIFRCRDSTKSAERLANRLAEEDFRSLGLKCLWVKEHSDIPSVLSKIK